MGFIFVAFIASVALLMGLGPGASTSLGKRIAFVVALLVAVFCVAAFSVDAFTIRAW